MKQLVLNIKNGQVELIETVMPKVSSNSVIIESKCSLISVGTERMLLEFGRASWIEKVKSQPEKVKQVIQKIKTDGLLTTLGVVKSKLEEPLPLGYCNVGIVREVGKNVQGIKVGDRVVSNGSHAEVVKVSKNLTAKIPENVNDETAVFTVIGAIALQGIRLLSPALGEYIAVIGLGLIGQIAVQLLLANGCKVIGIDIDGNKVKLAEKFGAKGFVLTPNESPEESVIAFSKGRGVDGVLITASTKSNEPIIQAAQMSRKRGRIVLIGVTSLNIPRNLFYEKEISFQVSSSYGPGRYDPDYEEKGIDYPLAYVRWTAQRNFEAVLDMLSLGKIDVKSLITHRFPFKEALKAYEIVLKGNPLGVILEYEGVKEKKDTLVLTNVRKNFENKKPVVGFLGVGNFARTILLPALKNTNAILKTIASSGGLSAVLSAKKFGFIEATSDYKKVINDEGINTVFICTRHGSHAKLVIECLKKNKHVFVEKPLALSVEEIKEIVRIFQQAKSILMVGFNRRFSKFTQRLKNALKNRKDPLCLTIMVNAGQIPMNHWVHDPEIGGGRVLGECCHFIDFGRYIVGSPIEEIYSLSTKGHSDTDEDKVVINLRFQDGSIGSIHYFANGSKLYPKERVEVFCENKVFVIDNFKSLVGYGIKTKLKSLKQDKGHNQEVKEFIKAISCGKSSPILFEEIIEISLATIAAYDSLRKNVPVKLTDYYSKILQNES